jgi:hypothetical protein
VIHKAAAKYKVMMAKSSQLREPCHWASHQS